MGSVNAGKEANKEYVNAIKNYADNYVDEVKKQMADPKMQKRLKEEANRLGIDSEQYVKQVAAQAVAGLSNELYEKNVQRYLPKSDAQYIISGVQNSIIGLISRAMMETPEQAQWRDEAQARYGEHAGTAAELANMGVSFAADAPFFGLSGSLSGAVVQKMAQRQIGRMVAEGLTRQEAQAAVGAALRSSFGKRMSETVVQQMVGGAVNLGAYNAMQSTVSQQARTGKVDLGEVAKETGRGAVTGAMLGGVGGTIGAATTELSGTAKMLSKVGSFGAEAATFTAADRIFGEDTGNSLGEDFVQNAMQLGVMKAASPGAWKNAAKTITNFRDAFRPSGEKMSPVKFDKSEQEELMQSTGGKDLISSLGSLQSEAAHDAAVRRSQEQGKAKATAGEGKGSYIKDGHANETQQQYELQLHYESLMNDPNVGIFRKYLTDCLLV